VGGHLEDSAQGMKEESVGAMKRLLGGSLICVGLFGLGCGGTKLIRVTFPQRDGNSEYWVCNREATQCKGKQLGDVDPLDYKPQMDTLAPPAECPHGVAQMELVIRGNEVLQVGHECAQPKSPTGLPKPPASGDPTGDGPAGVPKGPTGLPSEPIGLPDDAPTGLPDDADESSTEEAAE
jgi:hypothetical protein